jgi:type I restriction enzyme S subunit
MTRSRDGWTRVRFGDVVRLVRDRVNPETSSVSRYVAGEHMDTDDLRIHRWGEVGDGYLGPAFHMRFKRGHVLYGSRRTYLRKVAVADFEGICANTTFVLESADSSLLLPEFLPFVMQTEAFHDHSIKQSKGSVNPYVNFSDLAWYEFDLPPIEEQLRALDSLHTVDALCQTLHSAAHKGQALFTALVDSLIPTEVEGDATYQSRSVLRRLDEVTTRIVDGVHKKPTYATSGVPFLTVENLTRGPGIDLQRTRFVSPSDHREFSKRAPVEKGDVLVTKDGTLGVARVVDFDSDCSIFVSVALLKPQRDTINSHYLRLFFESSAFKRRLAAKTSGSALKHIHLVDFRQTTLPVPPLAIQEEIVRKARLLESGLSDLANRRAAASRIRTEVLRTVGPIQS